MKPEWEELGAAMKQQRDGKDLSQAEVAWSSHVYADADSVSRVEAGMRRPSRKNLIRILVDGIEIRDVATINDILSLARYFHLDADEIKNHSLNTSLSRECKPGRTAEPSRTPGFEAAAVLSGITRTKHGAGEEVERRRFHNGELPTLQPITNILHEVLEGSRASGAFTGDFARLIADQGSRLYRQGKYSDAYTAQRLAADLFEKQETQAAHSHAVASLIEAISALRPLRLGDAIKETMAVIERLCSLHSVHLAQRWLCLDRFALVLYDYGRWPESADVQYASEQLRNRVASDYPSDLVRFDRASSFRREALIKVSSNSLGNRETVSKILGRLLEDAEEFRNLEQFDGYATNLDVASKLALEAIGKPHLAHTYSESALDMVAAITQKWVLQEHYWREARYYHVEWKDRDRTFNNVVEALRLCRDHPVVLEPMLERNGTVHHDPSLEVKWYWIQEEKLKEHGVDLSTIPLAELPLPISVEDVGQFVRALQRSDR
jgi:hypothetical protein